MACLFKLICTLLVLVHLLYVFSYDTNILVVWWQEIQIGGLHFTISPI